MATFIFNRLSIICRNGTCKSNFVNLLRHAKFSTLDSVKDNQECKLKYLENENEGIAIISMNRPHARNALGKQFLKEFAACTDVVKFDKNLRVVILRSEVKGVFCAGADLKERAKMTNEETGPFVAGLRASVSEVANLPVPTIAAIDGFALGGGLEVSLACDMRVSSHDAKLGLVETRLAIIPGGGDRLTDERVQTAQKAMGNANTQLQRLEGFVSKTEDFHRLKNYLEAIHKMTYHSQSGTDRCTVYYYRNILNMRNVKGKVCNSYRAYKFLYYAILDAICLLLFLHTFGAKTVEEEIQIPAGFEDMSDIQKIHWIDNISQSVLKEWFFDNKDDICEEMREIVINPDHPENYWVTNFENGRLKCHHCDKTYAYIGTLQTHENKAHNVKIEKPKPKPKTKKNDQLHEYVLLLFKLTLLHKNLDTAVDMGDGARVVRSSKYELPIYNRTNKVKYLIGSIHLTALTSGILPEHQKKRLIANRFVNIQGGKNNNISLDEYLKMLNRDSKIACTGHQTKDSILRHSKEYPHLINFGNHFEDITQLRKKKGFHHLPSYKTDVLKILKDLTEVDVLTIKMQRQFHCKDLCTDKNIYCNAHSGLSNMIHRHRPVSPFQRLRDPHI